MQLRRCYSLFPSRSLWRAFLRDVRRSNSTQSFKFDDLKINIATGDQLKPKPDPLTLTFGTTFSDHMFEVEWTEPGGWGAPQILPFHSFQMHPAAKVFHYAQACFEGMKAFRCSDRRVALFRPELNMKRLLLSSERVALPSFDTEELLKCLKRLVSIDQEWVPGNNFSLYIRPTFIGIEDGLGVSSSKKTLLYIVMCPVGPYFKTGSAVPVSLLADPTYVRAFPGGVGSYKLAANYAPTLFVQKLAQEQGLDQVLWIAKENHEISEVGAMNVFFFLQKGDGCELVTPPLNGTILPGVVRQSVLDLARQWKEFEVSERAITMKEVIETNKQGRLLEMFICGTACSVGPVKSVRFLHEDIQIPTMDRKNPLFSRFLKTITDIQYGRIKSEWSIPVE